MTILSELTLSELSTEKKRRAAMVSFRIATLILMTAAGIMMTIRKGTSTSTFLPLAFFPIFLSICKGYEEVKQETKFKKEV